MRIALLHASVGGGHTRAAQAIAAALARRGHADVHVIDYNDLVPAWQRAPVQALYRFALGHAPALWRAYYRHTDVAAPTVAARALATAGQDRTADALRALAPDLVISTFTGAGALVGATRAALGRPLPHVMVATDFRPHRHWVRDGVDRWCAPSDDARATLIARGAPADRVIVTGLPIAPPAPADAARVRRELGLDARPIVVVAAGAEPTRRARRLIDALAAAPVPINALVCFPMGAAPASRHVRFVELGVTRAFARYLAAAELLVGKCGGATVAEATALGRAHVIYDPYPGQEEDNAAWLARHGAACWARTPGEIAPAVTALLTDATARARMGQAARALARPAAADAVVDAALALTGERHVARRHQLG